ncbi:hypothetical protein ACHQM5_009982 [Ranunculus cassubicifolius]
MSHQGGTNFNFNQVVNSNQAGPSAQSLLDPRVPSTTGSKAVPWTMQWTDNSSTANGVVPNSSYHLGQQKEAVVKNDQDGPSATSQDVASSSVGSSHVSQEYAGISSYSNSTDSYSHDNTGHQGYYYGYPPQTSNTYSQQAGAYQNSGAPYQPLSSFQNSGSYAGSTSYSSTYYNTGDYQTTGGYLSGSNGNQTTSWSDGSYSNYPSQQYTNYSSLDSNGAHSSSTAVAAPLSYEQQHKQWADYYSQTTSDVKYAPGTENTTSVLVQNCSISLSDSQPPPPGTTSWRQEAGSAEFTSVQAGAPSTQSDTHNGYWGQGTPGTQNNHVSQTHSYSQTPLYSQRSMYSQTPSYTQTPSYAQTSKYTQTPPYTQIPPSNQPPSLTQAPSYTQTPLATQTPSSAQTMSYTQTPVFPKPLDSSPGSYESQDIHKTTSSQGPNSQYSPMHQIPHNLHSPMQTISSFDASRATKVQIPTNPRIVSNFPLGLPKTEGATVDMSVKPAYVSVSVPKSDTKVLCNAAADTMLKPGAFPASLRAYVERALARCKNDSQKTACQNVMKEMITKASTDGTLFTRNWDVEPLFPLPNLDACNNGNSGIFASLPKYKRSPSRRAKSRWEPLPEEKLASVSQVSVEDVSWDHLKEKDKMGGKQEIKEDGWSNAKFLHSQFQNQSKNSQRPFKKPRFGDIDSVTENGDASSDSEKEQSLTAYYSGAVALANTPEEKKRRASRSKRFDKGQGQRAEIKHFRPKAGGGNLYTKRASAALLGKGYEDGGTRAVEDIDWDSLTVKGTCQEIEKRYLRLTSAPDPATVRPEEVLEKALQMVLSSQKNYLYKCDQLKSIRQDLTVQRIRNELTVKVYEAHARIALETGDLPEYNQCQSQLKILYAEGIKGCDMEFSAYNLLCVILHSNKSRDLVSSMARLSSEAKEDEAVKHALAVRSAVTSGNYVLFFRLYKTAPNLNTCLMDMYVEKMRFEAVKCMSRSYRPTVPLAFIALVLGFIGSEGDDDVLECEEWLRAHGAVLITDNSGDMMLDTKASSSSLFMPEPEDAVAHGDANLAVNDFLTRAV